MTRPEPGDSEMSQPTALRLEDRVVIVTGAGTSSERALGSGAAMARQFAAHGARVAVVDVSAAHATSTCQQIAAAGGESILVEADVTSESACSRVVATTIATWGRLDVLVNNVGISARENIANVELNTWERVQRVNLTSAMLMIRASADALANGGGAIVNISSIAAVRMFGPVAYATSKAALIALTKDAAYTLGPRGIRANCVLPGHIFAAMSSGHSAELRDRRRRSTVLGTEGTAWDIAAAALFLASDEARWITGVVIPVDGGTLLTTGLGMEGLNDADS